MRYGVPDDDMPDSSLPPGWGSPSFDDRDLDAVLAGETADISPGLRPVVDFLATLQAPAAPAELRGEAMAMAEFRALGLGQAAPPARLAPAPQPQAPPAGPRRRGAARHRSRRVRPPASPLAVAMSAVAAAAAVIVIVVAFTGNLPGPIQRLTRHQATPAAGHSAAPKGDTQSAAAATAHPEVTSAPAAPEPATACRAYFDYFRQAEPASSWSAEFAAWQRLSAIVGSQNPGQVYRDCAPYVSGFFPQWPPVFGQNPFGGHQGSQGNYGDNQSGSQNGQAGGPSR
jgi:hypothetical protein